MTHHDTDPIHVPPDERDRIDEVVGHRWDWWPGMQAVNTDDDFEGVRTLRVHEATFRGNLTLLQGWVVEEDADGPVYAAWYVSDGGHLDLTDRTTLACLHAQGVDLDRVRSAFAS